MKQKLTPKTTIKPKIKPKILLAKSKVEIDKIRKDRINPEVK